MIEFVGSGNNEAEFIFEDSAKTQLNLVTSGKCGNAVCSGSETCSNCPADCGSCPGGGDSESSGSGGGGGRVGAGRQAKGGGERDPA